MYPKNPLKISCNCFIIIFYYWILFVDPLLHLKGIPVILVALIIKIWNFVKMKDRGRFWNIRLSTRNRSCRVNNCEKGKVVICHKDACKVYHLP